MQTTYSVSRFELKVLALIVGVAMIAFMGTDIYLPSMPFIMQSFHSSKEAMQLSISLYFLGMGVSTFIWGPLSDSKGRRLAIILCLIIFIMATIALFLSQTTQQFLIARLFQGVGAGGAISVARSVVVDMLAGPRLAVIGSYFAMVVALSPLCAPLIGGYLQHWFDWQASFIVLAVFSFIVLLLFALFCPETHTKQNPNAIRIKPMLSNYKMILLNPKFLAYTFCSALGLSVSAIYATTSSFIFQVDYHFSPVKFGWVTMTIGLTAISAKFLNARLSANLGVLETLKSGFALVLISGAAMLVLALCHSLPALLLLIIILLAVIGQNLIGTNATSGALSPYKHIAGSAGALFASSQMLIVFIASSLIASLAIFGVAVLAMAYVIIGLLGLIVFIYLTHDCRRMRGVERNRA